jgi:hypothetical protein
MRGVLRRAAVAAGAAAVLLGSAVAAAGPAGADTNPCPGASSSTDTSCTYASTGAEQTFTVPSGVTAVSIFAVGASGGAGSEGALVTAVVPLPAGTSTLYVEVGGNGGSAASGFNGGGAGANGGTPGGGASDVRLDPNTTPLSTADTRLVVAGGGGGGHHQPGVCG